MGAAGKTLFRFPYIFFITNSMLPFFSVFNQSKFLSFIVQKCLNIKKKSWDLNKFACGVDITAVAVFPWRLFAVWGKLGCKWFQETKFSSQLITTDRPSYIKQFSFTQKSAKYARKIHAIQSALKECTTRSRN